MRGFFVILDPLFYFRKIFIYHFNVIFNGKRHIAHHSRRRHFIFIRYYPSFVAHIKPRLADFSSQIPFNLIKVV